MDNKRKEECYEFGYSVFGPFLASFTSWLHTKVTETKPSKIFFFSRDGYLMKVCYDILEARKPNHIPTEYINVSRKSLRTPLIWTKQAFERTLDLLSWQRFISYREVLSFWNIPNEKTSVYADKLDNFIPFEKLKDDVFLRSVYDANRNDIDDISREQYNSLQLYLAQSGMNGNVVIVDIGWHGSMQYLLEQFFVQSKNDVSVHGLYIGIGQSKKLTGRTDGFIYNSEEDPQRSVVLCFLGVMERLFQSFEGTTIGYKTTGNTAHPILDKFEYNAGDATIETIKAIQTAAVNYVKEGKEGNASELLRFGQKPTLTQLKIFKDFYTIDGGIKSFLLPQKRFYQYKISEFIHELSKSSWKTGFLKETFRLPFPYYCIYKLLKK